MRGAVERERHEVADPCAARRTRRATASRCGPRVHAEVAEQARRSRARGSGTTRTTRRPYASASSPQLARPGRGRPCRATMTGSDDEVQRVGERRRSSRRDPRRGCAGTTGGKVGAATLVSVRVSRVDQPHDARRRRRGSPRPSRAARAASRPPGAPRRTSSSTRVSPSPRMLHPLALGDVAEVADDARGPPARASWFVHVASSQRHEPSACRTAGLEPFGLVRASTPGGPITRADASMSRGCIRSATSTADDVARRRSRASPAPTGSRT